MRILVTGAAGFIGFHLSRKLLENSREIIGIDNLNTYYDPALKQSRLQQLEQYPEFTFQKVDIKDKEALDTLFETHRPTHVINLAAQAGVRYSIDNPYAYVDSNLIGFVNILEACRNNPVEHLLYASSSSVYGGNTVVPFSTDHHVDHPVSLYAATKKANELMAHTYSHLYGIPTTGLRFFTVYGPYGRPDMAYYSFTKDILAGDPIKVFNHGKMERDFTYIDDIVEGIVKLIDKPPAAGKKRDETRNVSMDDRRDDNQGANRDEPGTSFAPYKIYNIGNSKPVPLMRFISALETALGKEADKIYLDMQPGDVPRTYADVSELERDIGFKPSTSIEDGLARFVDWYLEYHQIEKKTASSHTKDHT
jgi:UDP-glucuronate 4-epimerase